MNTKHDVDAVRNAARLLDGQSRQMLNTYADLLDQQAKGLGYTPGLLDQTAPARIYLQIDPNTDNDDRDEPWNDAMGDNVSWCADSVSGCEIQYIRADLSSPSPTHPSPRPSREDVESACVAFYHDDEDAAVGWHNLLQEPALISLVLLTRAAMRAALTDYDSRKTVAPMVPDGWKLVPTEPTLEMMAAPATIVAPYTAKLVYQRMLAASPTPGES